MVALRLVTEDIETVPVSLSAGIAQLERSGPCPGLCVDLGYGAIARADGMLGQAGLVQRLMGHRLLLALAKDPAQKGVELPERDLEVTASNKELLDLVRVSR